MSEFVSDHSLQSDVIADVAKCDTPPKSLHCDVIVSLEKPQTSPKSVKGHR